MITRKKGSVLEGREISLGWVTSYFSEHSRGPHFTLTLLWREKRLKNSPVRLKSWACLCESGFQLCSLTKWMLPWRSQILRATVASHVLIWHFGSETCCVGKATQSKTAILLELTVAEVTGGGICGGWSLWLSCSLSVGSSSALGGCHSVYCGSVVLLQWLYRFYLP
jgi:hypothetical protein